MKEEIVNQEFMNKEKLQYKTEGKLIDDGFTIGDQLDAGKVRGKQRIFSTKSKDSLNDVIRDITNDVTKQELLTGFEVLRWVGDYAVEEESVYADTVILKKESTTRKNNRNNARKDTEIIRTEKKNHFALKDTLFTSSIEQRDRIMKTLKLDGVARKKIIQENQSLEEVLHRYLTNREREKYAKQGKDFFNRFNVMRDSLNANPFLSQREKAERLYNFAKPYEKVLVLYKEQYFLNLDETNRKEIIEEKLDRIMEFYSLYSGDYRGSDKERRKIDLLDRMNIVATDKSCLSKIREKARAADRSKEKEKDYGKDKNLTPEQIDGVYKVDRYVISQMVDVVANTAFLDKLLSLPIRDRLLVYGIVELDRVGALKAEDVAYIQTGYVPREAEFANKMSGLPGLLWKGSKRRSIAKRITNFRLEKLEAAMDYLGHGDVMAVQKTFADINVSKDSDYAVLDFMDISNVEQEYVDTNRDFLNEASTELSKKLALRDKYLVDTIKALGECRKAMLEEEKAWFSKKEEHKTVEEKRRKAKETYDKMIDADRNLSNAKRYYTVNMPTYVKNTLSDEAVKETFTGDERYPRGDNSLEQKFRQKPKEKKHVDKVNEALFAVTQPSVLLAKLDKIITFSEQGTGVDFGLNSDVLSGASNAFSSIVGIAGMIGGLTAMYSMTKAALKNGDDMSITSMIISGIRAQTTYWSSTWGATAGLIGFGLNVAGPLANKFVDWGMEGVAGEIARCATTASSIVNYIPTTTMAVYGVKAAVDVADGIGQVKRDAHHVYARYRFNKLIKAQGAEKLEGTEADYAKNILAVDVRNKVTEGIKTLDSFFMNGLGVAATFFGVANPAVLVGYASLSVVNSLLMKGLMYAKKEHDHKTMIDEFFGIDAYLLELDKKYNTYPEWKKDYYKNTLRDELAGELGFATVEGMSKHVAGRYGEFVYNKLFYNGEGDNRTMLTQEDNKAGKLTQTSLACYQLVKSLGLRVTFLSKEEAKQYNEAIKKGDKPKKIPHPPAGIIAAKLL
ncbi:MAG: hypothetical protein IKO61_09900 [Lachnospiraceae bacterium]|nr:hypothetical protein [Lachnospiraceae bacterium]